MRKTVSYGDAVALLGGSGPVVAALDGALGGALLLGTAGGSGAAVSLFGAKAEGIRLGREVIGGLRDRLRGYSRYDRTQRIQAAHAVVAVTAFFEALDGLDLPFDTADLRLTREEQMALAEGGRTPVASFIEALLSADVPLPAPHRPYELVLTDLGRWSAMVAGRLAKFVGGLAIWDHLDQRTRDRVVEALNRELPVRACNHYESLYRRLAAEVPEFAFWSAQVDQSATRVKIQGVYRSLDRLEELLQAVSFGHAPDERRAALTRAWRAVLERPILTDSDAPTGLTIPTLESAYVDPDFRVRAIEADTSPAEESWWDAVETRGDLAAFLAGHLTSPGATQAPLLILGQPGAGKSVLTRVLAARLPASDFLMVRVALREVPADGDLQDQIEYAVRDATGEALSWPDLARSADDALPVILLDGFDELLQATGVSQSDYLMRVARFQQREADQGRPVAVLVTSRTAVADRAKAPSGTIAVRLEPFRPDQVEQWLKVWGRVNAAVLSARGLAPLTAEVAMRRADLATQPLLLLMLALYDADANALQRGDEQLDASGLYERLLNTFAEREVRKSHPGVPEDRLVGLVETELLRLSVAAFAMFNRNRQWVTVNELGDDLVALLGEQPTSSTGLRAALDTGDIVLGRFFFVQRAQAVRDGTQLETYEFLHATFGEYLVARLVLRVLEDLAAQELAAASAVLGSAGHQDGLLHALLSFATLSNRGAVISFLHELATTRGDQDRWPTVRELPITLFRRIDARTDSRYDAYIPSRLPEPSRYAVYGANLVLVAVVFAGKLLASALFPDSDVVSDWRRHALGWRAALPPSEWWGLVRRLYPERIWEGDRRDLQLKISEYKSILPRPDPVWFSTTLRSGSPADRFAWADPYANGLPWQANMLCDPTLDQAVHAIGPALEVLGMAAASFVVPRAGVRCSILHALLRIWLDGDPSTQAGSDLVSAFEDAVFAALHGWPPWEGEAARSKALTLVLIALQNNALRLPAGSLVKLLDDISRQPQLTGQQEYLMIDAILRALATPPSEETRTLLLPTLTGLLLFRGEPHFMLQAWVGLCEAGIPATDQPPGLQPPERFLAGLPWEELAHSAPSLVWRARVLMDRLDPGLRQAVAESQGEPPSA